MKKPLINLSSLSQKYVMALAGMFLMLFLIAHLSTNLLMLRSEIAFNEAVSFLTTNPVIKITEYVLFAAFLVHIILGVLLQLYNYYARPIRYRKPLRTETSAFSRYMFHTGVIIFIFLVIHLANFFFIRLGISPIQDVGDINIADKSKDVYPFYKMSVELFKNPWYSAIYLVSFVFLGFHLKHGFQSAFQSLGLNHTKYTPAIKAIGTIYAIAISVGFAIIPVYFLFFYG